ncbi:hypothetical protein [Planomonospora parontospora]|uniref:hypothetical protein n=1 Tax=Planomonospora parontospora TaxID=58119 RepID=UPI00166FC2C3|nr:hypothetical protein [Planomonospora parontospora]
MLNVLFMPIFWYMAPFIQGFYVLKLASQGRVEAGSVIAFIVVTVVALLIRNREMAARAEALRAVRAREAAEREKTIEALEIEIYGRKMSN